MKPLCTQTRVASAPSLVLAIHGILTGQTDVSWPDRFHAYLGTDATMLKCEYRAGPFPIWNHFVRNGRLARARANEIAEMFEYRRRVSQAHADVGSPRRLEDFRVGIVAHSNGCDIAIRTVRELAKRGILTDSIVLTGSVTSPDVKRSGLLELMVENVLGRAYAYCNGADFPLRLPFAWPYSDLGRRGWQDVPAAFTSRFVTRWFPGYGHSGYFSRANRDATFALFREDLGIPRSRS